MSKLPKKTTRKQTPETPPEKASKTSSTGEDLGSLEEVLKAAMECVRQSQQQLEKSDKLHEQLKTFHESLEEAGEDDLRMYWDVRLVKGKSTPYDSAKGSTSFPAALAAKMRTRSIETIQNEIIQKIALPITAKLIEDDKPTERHLLLSNTPVDDLEAAASKSGGDALLGLARVKEEEGVEDDD